MADPSDRRLGLWCRTLRACGGVVKDLWIDCVAAAGNRSSLSGLWAGIFEFVG